jgi:serine/threonine-protein kinase
MASVFAARQRGPQGVGRLVAVKVMSLALADEPSFQKMFLREATIATRLEHPNVVRVYEVGEDNGDLYLAMELVHGVTLSALQTALKERAEGASSMPLPVALAIACDVARGLHAAHELTDDEGKPLELVHQDVSPQNVMVSYDGLTKLLDFGVARIGAVDASRTETVRGKPSYLAPEQLRGERIDRRTDVFALGILLYELVTGERLFRRETLAEIQLALLAHSGVELRETHPDVPEAIAAIVTRALAPKPEDRFASCEELRRAIRDARSTPATVTLADDLEVAAWVRGVAPPTRSTAELARELQSTNEPRDTSLPDVFELPTEAPLRRAAVALSDAPTYVEPVPLATTSPTSRTTSAVPSRRRTWLALALAALTAGGVAAYSLRGPATVETMSPMPSAFPIHITLDEPTATPTIPSVSVSAPPPVLSAPSASATSVTSGPARASLTASAAPPKRRINVSIMPAMPVPAEVSFPGVGAVVVSSNVVGTFVADDKEFGSGKGARVQLRPGFHRIGIRTDTSLDEGMVLVVERNEVTVIFRQ